jgi:redox-sensing transcriptional repressor
MWVNARVGATSDGLRRVSARAAARQAPTRAVPEATVVRWTTYLQALTRVAAGGAGPLDDGTISSEQLAALAGVNPAKLRKDLSYLGSQGTRGVGYDTAGLTATLEGALGAHEVYPVAIVGLGHLGSALAGYPGFAGRGLPIRVLLDADPRKVGTAVAGITVADIRDAGIVCREHHVVIGVITTPESAAQQVVDVLIGAGVRSILNFAPGRLVVPDDVSVRRVDLALELNLLAFHESRRGPSRSAATEAASMPPMAEAAPGFVAEVSPSVDAGAAPETVTQAAVAQ